MAETKTAPQSPPQPAETFVCQSCKKSEDHDAPLLPSECTPSECHLCHEACDDCTLMWDEKHPKQSAATTTEQTWHSRHQRAQELANFEPPWNGDSIGCGLEDRSVDTTLPGVVTACAYGWDEALRLVRDAREAAAVDHQETLYELGQVTTERDALRQRVAELERELRAARTYDRADLL